MKRTTLLLAILVALSCSADAQVGTWVQQQIPMITGFIRDIDMVDAQFGFAVGVPDIQRKLAGVTRTMDGGINWTPTTDFDFDPAMPDYANWFAVCVVDHHTTYIGGDSALMYKTTDGGDTWVGLNLNPKYKATIRSIHFISHDVGYVVGGNSFFMTNGAFMTPPFIMKTRDGGQTWTDETLNWAAWPGDPALYSIGYKDGKWVVCGEFSTVGYNDGTGGWVKLPTPSVAMNEEYYDLSITSVNDIVVTGTEPQTPRSRVHYSFNGGNRFFPITPSGLPANVTSLPTCHFFSGQYGWVGASQSYIAVTTNAGMNWQRFQVSNAMPTTTPMTHMDFVDSLTGWAAGGDDVTNEGWIIRYYGTPPKPDISYTPTSVTFKDATCEPSRDTTLLLRNAGTGELVIAAGDISFSAPEFSLVGVTFPIRIAPQRSKVITIRWRPSRTSSGPETATMTIHSNDPDHPNWYVSLNTNRFYGTMTLDAVLDMPQNRCLRDSIEYMTYAQVAGNRPPTFIAIERIAGVDEFRLVSPAPGIVVPQFQPFVFRFRPTQPGPRTATFRIISGNPSCPDTSQIEVRGFGDYTKVTASTVDIDFGKVCVNTWRDTAITMKNVGNTYAYIMGREWKGGVDVFPDMEPIPLFIKEDSSTRYRLRFAPGLTGAFSADYRVLIEPCRDTISLRLRGEAISTEISFVPGGGVTVGPTIVNRPVLKTVTIRNTGKTAANVTSVRLADTFSELTLINVPPMPRPLPVGQSFDVVLRYLPPTLGTRETKLLVAWDAVCRDTARLDVSAPCLPNPFIVPPVALDCGLQPCPKPVRDTAWIRNDGNGPLVFYGASITGPDKAHFTLIKPAVDDTLRARDSVRCIVEYNRPTEGYSTASLFLNHSDAERMPTYIALAGHRTIAEYTLEGDSATPFFTRIFVPQPRTFTIRNSSNQPVVVSGIEVVTGKAVYAVANGPALPKTLAGGQSVTFDVVFTPNGRGPFRGEIRVSSSTCGIPWLLGLTGSGDTEGLAVDRGALDYQVDPCSYAEACDTLRLSNQGLEPVEVTGLAVTQASAVFTMTPPAPLPFTVGPGTERLVIICASPAFRGRNTATLTITSSDPVYPQITVQLTAEHDSANIAVSASAVDFGRGAWCATDLTRDVTVTNTGDVTDQIGVALRGGAAFSVSGPSTVTLLAGRSHTFTVTFLRPAAGVFADTVDVTTQRCARTIPLPLAGEYVDQRYAASPPTLVFPAVNLGASTTRPVTIQNNGGFSAHIAAVRVQPGTAFSVLPGYPTDISAGGSASFQLRYTPSQEGSDAASFCVLFDAPCADTVCVQLSGSCVRGNLVISAAQLSFPTLAQCETATLRDTLRNNGSGTITLLSSAIAGSGAAAFTNLTPVAAAEPLAPGVVRPFEIQYNAALAPGDGPLTATLTVVTDDAVQPVIDIPLSAARSTLRASADVVTSLGVIEVNQPVQRLITLRNSGSARLCYTAERHAPELTFTPALPICIEPGDTAVVTATYTALAAGPSAGSIVLLVASPCADSTRLIFGAAAQQGTLTQTSMVDFGVTPSCVAVLDTIVVTNTYAQAVTLDSLRITGPDAAFFTVQSPASLPLPIPAGGSVLVIVRFTGQNATLAYLATLTGWYTVTGQPTMRASALTASTVRPAFSVTPVAFPPTIIADPPAQAAATITNTTAITVHVDAVTVANPAFRIRNLTPAVPCDLGPGATITAQLEFAPTQAQAYTDSLVVVSVRPCALRVAAPLTGTGIPHTILQTTITLPSVSAMVDDVLLLPIVADQDLGNSAVGGWSGTISFNPTMLYPLAVNTAGTMSAGMGVTMSYDQTAGALRLTAGSGTLAGGSIPLAIVAFRVLIGDDVTTPLRLSTDFSFLNGYATVTRRVDGDFTLLGYCRAGERLIRPVAGTLLRQNHPNPVPGDAAGVTTIDFRMAGDGHALLTLHDMMGREVRTLINAPLSAGEHRYRLTTEGLPAGVYSYTLVTDGFRATRQLVISR